MSGGTGEGARPVATEAPEPLIVLGPPRSFTSVVSAMLGQHPQTFGFPEIHPFAVDTVAELFVYYRITGRRRRDGLMRVIAQLYWERQDVEAVELAGLWLREQLTRTTAELFQELREKVAPRVVVEKSVSTIWRKDNMDRLGRALPNAWYLHLTRHPRAQCESMLEVVRKETRFAREMLDYSTEPPTIDPQILWLQHHTNIVRFLEGIPDERKRRVRGEDVLTDPRSHLRRIAEWLGLRTEEAAIEEMLHPERSPFSVIGPINAPFGNDPKFIMEPALRPGRAKPQSLKGGVSWRRDIEGFWPEVQELAEEFGYE